jgi:hypothetical protein
VAVAKAVADARLALAPPTAAVTRVPVPETLEASPGKNDPGPHALPFAETAAAGRAAEPGTPRAMPSVVRFFPSDT